jgi:riboflavin biosynthesis pyrimidine reductase
MHLLLPAPVGPAAGAHLDDDALARLYAYPDAAGLQRQWVRANFVSTLDGAATGTDGRSGSINTGADRQVFALLRALADVVVVGAGTARAEGYRRVVTRSRWRARRQTARQVPHPAIAVVSRSAQVPPLLAEQREESGAAYLLTCAAAGPAPIAAARTVLGEDHVLVHGNGSVDLAAGLADLSRRGMPRVLVEGGPHLMRDLVAAGLLDELCLTLVPTVIGGEHPRITAGPPVTADLQPVLLIESEGSLLGRWTRPGRTTAPGTP